MSVTQIGNYVAVISFLLQLFHVNIGSEEVSKAAEAIATIIGLGVSWYGRYRIGDLTVGGFRK
jgi:hypothetical protein